MTAKQAAPTGPDGTHRFRLDPCSTKAPTPPALPVHRQTPHSSALSRLRTSGEPSAAPPCRRRCTRQRAERLPQGSADECSNPSASPKATTPSPQRRRCSPVRRPRSARTTLPFRTHPRRSRTTRHPTCRGPPTSASRRQRRRRCSSRCGLAPLSWTVG